MNAGALVAVDAALVAVVLRVVGEGFGDRLVGLDAVVDARVEEGASDVGVAAADACVGAVEPVAERWDTAWPRVPAASPASAAPMITSARTRAAIWTSFPKRGQFTTSGVMMVPTMDRIGRYVPDAKIGTGAFAAVWRAHDVELDVPVAIKVLAEHWVDDLDVRDRFVREARLLRTLGGERIVAVHDIGELDDGRPYFVMDLADAGTLADLVKTPAPPREALRLAVEACDAVETLHQAGTLHRDIKPSNLLLRRGRDGRPHVLLADLGLAKDLSELSRITVTAGSPGYMAPEQAAGTFDHRADVYALGAVTVALLSGRPPYPDEKSVASVVARPRTRRPEPVAHQAGLSPALDEVLTRTLSMDPDERPASAAELGRALREFMGEDAHAAARPVAKVVAARGPAVGAGTWLAALVVFAVVTGLTWWVWTLLD